MRRFGFAGERQGRRPVAGGLVLVRMEAQGSGEATPCWRVREACNPCPCQSHRRGRSGD